MSDVTVYGATGFVGRLVAAYLTEHHPDVSLTLAGRDRARLEAAAAELGGGAEIAVADAFDRAALDRMVAATGVVISTVGPYLHFGADLVAACAAAGRDYVDLCGEAPFVRRMIDAHHDEAAARGARVVHSCGFDSVPSDLGMLANHHAADGPFEEAVMVVHDLRGGLSGGTLASMRGVVDAARDDAQTARVVGDAHGLCPDPASEADVPGLDDDSRVADLGAKGIPGMARAWAGPFFMASYNTRVVHRSNALLGHAYGAALDYHEYILTGRGLRGRVLAEALRAVTGAAFALAASESAAPLLDRVLPGPGEGPDAEERAAGGFAVVHSGRTASAAVYQTTVAAEGDPGYEVTVTMLAEAALHLRETPGDGGVLTPATGLGLGYLERLRGRGLRAYTRRC
ncbi:saccharopine dehydrogenase family protein [Corynebacterium frankenforstense]